MASKERFKNYTAIQLATNVDFISWVKWPDDAGDLFWKEFINQYPLQNAAIIKAKAIVSKMHIVQPSPNEDNAEKSWQEIVQKIEAENSYGYQRTISIYKKWMAAAAVFILLMGGVAYFLLQNRSADNIVINTVNKPLNDIAPG